MSRAMKDSGIPWIGEIPENWEVKRLKQESIFINGFAFDSEDFKIDEGVRVIRIGDIGLKADFENCVRAITNSSILKPYRIEDGDILIAMSGATTGKCCIVDKSEEAYINQRVGIIRSDIRKIIYYSLQTPYFMEFVNLNNVGSAQPNISSKVIGEFPILSIPTTEQQRISEFLDRKCAEVDEMIALQEQIIEELKAYKQSVITEAVTKGLNPAAPMRDSGIEWIGDIPEHWEQGRLKNYFHLHGRIGWNGLRSDEFQENSYAYLVTGQDFVSRNVDWSRCYQIRKERYDEDEYIQLKNGDILVTKDGTIGKVAVVSNLDKPACLNSGIFVVKQFEPKKYYPDFIYWLFVSPMLKTFNDFLNLGGTTIIHLYQNVFERMPMILPPFNEQQAIADFLNTKCTEIDNLISIKLSKIDSLKEYKKSIIYEYVTGKKEVIE